MPDSESVTAADSTGSPPIVNLAGYLFVTLNELPRRRAEFKALCESLDLKGTILLSPEGINLFVAGTHAATEQLVDALRADPILAPLDVKKSLSKVQPFERMLVKIKNEIIAFNQSEIDPRQHTSPEVSATELKSWLASGKQLLLLDVRNDYEVQVGTFENAKAIGINHFRDFPEAVERLPRELREMPVVTFCTGGIRCEKAAPYLERAGFQQVYQLRGGILKYFEEVGGDYYQGECFVFDKRVALDPRLQETETTQCYACLSPLSVEDQQSPLYCPPHACPKCHKSPEEEQQVLRRQRELAIRDATTPLPGSVPHENVRPLNVAERYDGLMLREFLSQRFPHLDKTYWDDVLTKARLRQHGEPVTEDRSVRAGEQFAILEPATREPDVNARIELIHEDDALVIVNKPAPLPMHPSGRFHRNTLLWILNSVYAPLKLRPAHRLDANTTGLALFCKTRAMSRIVQPQFENGSVAKMYLARVQGHVSWDEMTCDAPISREPSPCGGRTVDHDGLPACTRCECLARSPDGTSLLRVIPETGRTNQIRVHLWHLGHPVCGDPLYLPGGELGDRQTCDAGEVMMLHCESMTLLHPLTRELTTWNAQRPDWVPECELLS